MYLWPDNRSCLAQISPCGTGATGITLLISPKSWHKRHFLGDVNAWLVSSGGGCGGRSNDVGRPCFMHSLLTLCRSSSVDGPVFLCAFCANTNSAMHLTSAGCMGNMMPPSSISLTFAQGIQHVRDCTITIETAVCPMADRGTQMGPMAVHVMGPYVGPMP